MRRAAKVDTNHLQVVRALEAVGATVQSLAPIGKGCPDILVGYRRQSFLLEIKDGARTDSRKKLTPDQETWHRIWRGLPVAVVETVGQALRAIGVNEVNPREGKP